MESASSLFLGVEYLKARVSELSKEFHPRVVRRDGSVRMRDEVCHDLMTVSRAGGKSEPRSRIHDMVLEDVGAGENRRPPIADHVPAPPRISYTDSLGAG